jgi:zinc protease
LKAWLAPCADADYLEVSIVGDVEAGWRRWKPCASTLGALPERAAEKPAFKPRSGAVAFPKAPADRRMPFSTEIPKAVAALYWPTGDMSDIQRTRRLTLLASILDDRLRIKVREELGETYSPACYHVASDTFTGYGYMTAMIECKPEQAAALAKLVTEIADGLAEGPITEPTNSNALRSRC